MKTANCTTTAAAIVLAFGLGVPAFAQANDPEGYGDGYHSGAYGRVRSADAGATIMRADAESAESDSASVNTPLFPGDTLRTDRNQRVEVQLAGGSTVRIDNSGEVVFQSMPNPSAKFQDNTVIALHSGVIRIASHLGEKEEFRIDTRDASVYLLGEGEFRIAADDRGGTRVASLRGVAEVVGNDASVLVRGGMGTSAVAGSDPDAPRAYTALVSDGFDRWCDSRDDIYRVHDRYATQGGEPTDVPDEVRPYYGELSTQGTFDVDPDYGTVWYPTGVANDWRPYNDGYWSYGPGGYFWVSNEPWGWAPYHYGNWQWTVAHHWCWVPGRIFAGAWVSWSWGSLYVGWAPLDYWGRPGWIGGPYYNGFYDPGCWTFVNYSNIHASNIHRYAVPIGTVRDDLRHATVVARGPRVDPKRIARSPEWRDKALRMVADDHAAHMRPIEANRRPERTLSDAQDHMLRRSAQGSPSVRAPRRTIDTSGGDPRPIAPRPRRIFDDPRDGGHIQVRPETRDDVRELYQRMSRPRETRGQGAAPRDQAVPRAEAPRSQPPRQQAPRAEAPRSQPPRQQAPRAEAPRSQPPRQQAPRAEAPRSQSPRQQAPRAEPPRSQSPRSQAPRAQAPPQAKAKHGDRH